MNNNVDWRPILERVHACCLQYLFESSETEYLDYTCEEIARILDSNDAVQIERTAKDWWEAVSNTTRGMK